MKKVTKQPKETINIVNDIILLKCLAFTHVDSCHGINFDDIRTYLNNNL